MLIKDENLRFILGLKIKQLRKSKNLSQTELAQASDISVSYLNEIESGKKYPKREKIFVVAEVLGTSYNELVSVELDPSLQPLYEILKSNLLSEIPFEDFGIDISKVFEIFSNAPARASAFINTFFEMVRRYNVSMHDFYLSALRSYLEINKNYFEDIEHEASFLREAIFKNTPLTLQKIEDYLRNKYGYVILETSFDDNKKFALIRTCYAERDGEKFLLLSKHLTPQQKLFALCRELGYQVLKLSIRPSLDPQLTKAEGFDDTFNHYKARYFASAFLLPMDKLSEDLENSFTHYTTWDPNALLELIKKVPVTPETFFHRLTTILPQRFDVNSLFFLKIQKRLDSDKIELEKELHLGGLQGPHATASSMNYCHRWVSVDILNEFQKLPEKKQQNMIADAQISNYFFSNRSYFCISVAMMAKSKSNTIISLTIGIENNKDTNHKIGFINDEKVKRKVVGVVCEQCLVQDCKERRAPFVSEVDHNLEQAEVDAVVSKKLGSLKKVPQKKFA